MKHALAIFILTVLTVFMTYPQNNPQKDEQCTVNIIGEIGKLENNRDPKCHATATRLENFMYGTRLEAGTRFEKVKLQKKLLLHLWETVTRSANQPGNKTPQPELLRRIMKEVLPYSRKPNGDIVLTNNKELVLEKRDMDHYASVAYALRSILALQQDMLFRPGIQLVNLEPESIAILKEFTDIVTLATLQVGDRKARMADKYSLSPDMFRDAWENVLGATATKKFRSEEFWSSPAKKSLPAADKARERFATLNKIIQQKVKSYEAYNNISMKVFLRNLQVYFARHRWPADAEEGSRFRNLFTESMVQFAFHGLNMAGQTAGKRGGLFIREQDVDRMWQSYVPFDVNEYEDVIFFPNLEASPEDSGRLTIEAYDFDAFRDSGIHWRYLQFALQDHGAKLSIEPDPFAAELLVEGIAQFGVLVLRVAGMKAKKAGDKRLKVSHLQASLEDIQRRITLHAKAKPASKAKTSLASSGGVTRRPGDKTYFSDVTAHSGIRFSHRSSDWLSRLLRSYLKKSESLGTLDVPPAFGGSGTAAGDVNNDGITDVLLLSGAGNALYLGDGKGKFRDVTRQAGIRFKRPDGQFGEPRQPIIADLDNDGHQDILVTYANDNHKLYKNLGNGTFKDVSQSAGLGGAGLTGGPAVVFDYDNDGLLDVYIAYFGNYLKGDLPSLSRENLNGLPNKLFRNTGGLHFQDVTAKSGVGNTGWGQALAHTDLDRDGRQDIIVGNDFGINVYYRNRGDGTFENIAPQLGTDKPSFTMNVGITDLNRDGFPDIYISNIVTMVKDEKYVLPSAETKMRFDPARLARMRVVEANDLFLSHAGTGKLQKYINSDAVGRGFSSTGWAWGANFFDFDNDGDDDLYCVNGMNEYSVYSDSPYYTKVFKEKRHITLPVYQKESNVFFVNEGGKLQNFSKESGTDYLGNSRSTVYVDFDNDGDLDILLNNYHGPAIVYQNHSEHLNNRWLKLKLQGDPSRKTNRDAIGARITVSSNNKQLSWREIRGGEGYLSMVPKTQHIGAGKEKTVNIDITWPNGDTNTFKNIATNRAYHLKQGQNEQLMPVS